MEIKLNPSKSPMKLKKGRLAKLSKAIKEQEKTIGLYQMQIKTTTQSLSKALKTNEYILSTIQSSVEHFISCSMKGTPIASHNRNSLTFDRLKNTRKTICQNSVEELYQSPKHKAENKSRTKNERKVLMSSSERYKYSKPKNAVIGNNKMLTSAPELWKRVWKVYSLSFCKSEVELYNLLVPLLTGTCLHLKFINSQYNKGIGKSFEFLNASTLEKSGYYIKHISLNDDLTYLAIRQNKTDEIQGKIKLGLIESCTIPPQAIDIIKSQEKVNLKERIFVESKLNNTSGCYQFSIELSDGSRLGLLAKECKTLKTWVMGINSILNNEATIDKFRQLHTSILNSSL